MDDSYKRPINLQQNTQMYMDLIIHIMSSGEEGEEGESTAWQDNYQSLTISLRE